MSLNSPTTYQVSQKLIRWSLLIGLLGLAIALFGLFRAVFTDDGRLALSWLIGFSVWFSISIGLFFLLMIFNVFDAGWSVIIRRQLEHALGFFPWLAVIFVPLLLISWFGSNPGLIWDWMNPDLIPVGEHTTVAHDPIYLKKAGLLNLPFFTIRVIVYFFIFWFLTFKLRQNSFQMDIDGNLNHSKAIRIYSAIGIPVVALLTTLAAVDFFMSLSYQWFSTMYGVWFFATSMRAGLAVITILCIILASRSYLKNVFTTNHLYLLGCIFLAFTVFWAYITFCQYFLIYNANVPEETFWYNVRELTAQGGKSSWWWLSLWGLVLCYFVIPFLFLLFYRTKVVFRNMFLLSIWILIFFVTDLYFNILPAKVKADTALGYSIEPFMITFWDIAAIIGIGSLWLWSFLRSTTKAQAIPIHDPRIEESLHTHT